MPQPSASATVHVDASPEAVYDLITDLPTLAALAEETESMEWRKGHNGGVVRPGAVFVGHNKNGNKRWTTKCTVTDAEPGRVFAFDVRYAVLPVARWQYDIVATEGGCSVTESTWDRRPGWFRKVAPLATGVADRASANAEHIAATLQRLKQRAEERA
ncbi:polyketide cyclase [Mycobacterium intermedium]|uniref:Polyketide cyclase n=1 Tax=Mycobacterium intermedium TaxID=28445 RepID=A0A1E3SBD1_MYCIE|nr:SRPBCC family protein [Mycobacterium intermedium]MCV6965832.1 SRPBCC family protein [Mycobacterium intermedium]ODQ99470.1 polyketide cyclase [Mycobacterium intermedium]OPE50759.1 polyketide cyclase [Mycobacterium intermedium]ORB10037.1 polyketide cyclase [Mycobacterium intermedium]